MHDGLLYIWHIICIKHFCCLNLLVVHSNVIPPHFRICTVCHCSYNQDDKAWRCSRRLKRDISSQFNLATEKQQINNREFDNLLQAKSQLLCLPLLCLRVPQPRQRSLPDLLHGLLPWRGVHYIW